MAIAVMAACNQPSENGNETTNETAARKCTFIFGLTKSFTICSLIFYSLSTW